MKIVLIVLSFVLLNSFSFAQDIIYLKNGKELKVKIKKINASEVIYKLYNNLEGPTLYKECSSIAQIIFENGTVQVFKKSSFSKSTSDVKNIIVKSDSSLVVSDSADMPIATSSTQSVDSAIVAVEKTNDSIAIITTILPPDTIKEIKNQDRSNVFQTTPKDSIFAKANEKLRFDGVISFYLNDKKYNGLLNADPLFQDFPEANTTFIKGKNLYKFGKPLVREGVAVGIISMIIGGGFLMINSQIKNPTLVAAGLSFISLGVLGWSCVIPGKILLAASKKKFILAVEQRNAE
jgi:hypothetical protein